MEYTITVFSENKTGLLSRIVGVITRRHINIESINASKSSIEGIHRFSIVVDLDEESVRKLTLQIDKQIDVLKAYYDTNEDIVYQEIALYKVSPESFYGGAKLEKLIRAHNARIIAIEKEYIVIEKTGYQHETDALLNVLRPYGVYEFVRSGRVAIVKEMERLNTYLNTIKVEQPSSN